MNKYPERFLLFINVIIDEIEKGFSNHKDDRGGETNWGITKALARAHGYQGDMRKLTRDRAIDIYYREFWNAKIVDSIHNYVAFHLFDCAINSGYTNAIKILQRAVGIKDDGKLGTATMNALSKLSERDAILKFCIARMHFYGTLWNFKTFGRGWRNRLFILADVNWEAAREKYLN